MSFPTIHVVLRRPDAVFRLNQWLPELRAELHRSHSIKISLGAKEAFDAIVRHFQKTESGGIFDDSSLSTTEKVDFKPLFFLVLFCLFQSRGSIFLK